jgi:hypothetical protein
MDLPREIAKAGAARHCPAGHFSPYSDGRKDTVVNGFANQQRGRIEGQR